MNNNIKKILFQDFNFKNSFYFFIILSTLYIFPFINNNIPFRDDNVRVLNGSGWGGIGRNLADFLFNSLSFSFGPISNIAPLPWFLSIICLAFTLTYFIQNTCINKKLNSHIAISFIFINPFYLQNLSYQFDSLSMTLGICLVIFSYIIQYDKKINIFYSFLFLLASIFLFQPVSNIFILLAALDFIINIKKNKNFKQYIILFLVYSSAIISYYLLFKLFFSYTSQSRSGIHHFSNLFDLFYQPLNIFFIFFKSFILSTPGLFFSFIFPFFIWAYLSLIIKNGFNFKIILKIIAPFIIFLSLWGPFILLDATFARPRVFVTFGFIVMSMFLVIDKNLPFIKNFNLILTSIICLSFISIDYQYNQLNKEEFSYDKMLTEWISKDINDNKELYSQKLLLLNSHPNYSPASSIILQNNPFLQYVKLPYYNWFSRYYIQNRGVEHVYKDLRNLDEKYDWQAICIYKNAKIIKENRYYNIYIINRQFSTSQQSQEHVSVWFKRDYDICKDQPNLHIRRDLFFFEK